MSYPSLKDMICPFCKVKLKVQKNDLNDKFTLLCNNEKCPFIVRSKKQFKTAQLCKDEFYKWQVKGVK